MWPKIESPGLRVSGSKFRDSKKQLLSPFFTETRRVQARARERNNNLSLMSLKVTDMSDVHMEN